jgi:hypothetical protein
MLFSGLLTAFTLGAGAGDASAAACDTSWLGGNGNWSEAGNWSNGVPGGAQPNACITADGTYTVSVTALNGNFNNSIATASSLTLGGSSGQQTIAVTGTFTDQTASASLSLAGGTVGPNGRIVFDSNDPNHVAGTSLCAGDTPALVNEGVISFEAGTGGGRTIQGTLENKGTLNFSGNAEIPSVASCGGNHLNNAGGTIDIAVAKTLTVKGKFTQSGGTTNVNGSMNGAGNFTLSGGTFTGSAPVLSNPMIFSPSGVSGTFVVHGSVDFGSSVGPGVTVIDEATASENALLSFRAETNPATNAGTIKLTSSDAGHTATLQGPEGNPAALTNTGTIETLPGAGGGRTLGSGLTNAAAGAIKIGADTDGSCCSSSLRLLNKGAITVDAGKEFSLGGAPFTQTGGTTAVNGKMTGAGNSVFAVEGGSFTGNAPVLTGKFLKPTGGSGSFVVHGSTDFISDIGKDITLAVEGVVGENARLNERAEANHSTNAGTIKLTSAGGLSLAELSAADANPDSLFNTGTIEVQQGAGGERWLSQAITNKSAGTIAVNADTKGSFMRVANAGTISVSPGKTLSFGEPLTQTAGAMIVNGALTTNQPIAVQGGALRGSGAVTASTVSNTGGVVHPGNSPGVLSITGDYTQGAGGTLAADIAGSAPGSGYSRLAVSGNVMLDGTLDVSNGFVPATGQAFQVLTAGGTLGGAFSSTVVHGEPGYDVQYNPKDVTLLAHALPVPPAPPAGGGSSTPPVVTPGPQSEKPLKCKRGFKKKKVKGKSKCVKVKPKKKGHKH